MRLLSFIPIVFLAASSLSADEVILVVGAPGDDDFGAKFEEQAGHWNSAAETASAEVHTLRNLETLEKQLATSVARKTVDPLWIILIGHGTFDERAAKFNLAGPDLSAGDLAAAGDRVAAMSSIDHDPNASAAAALVAAAAGRGDAAALADQMRALRDARCDALQGWLLGRPGAFRP